ncbi:hypothetical protein KR084_004972, partial [Drosophila pseudotakahashii]
PSRWIYSRVKAELLAFAAEFGFSAEGVVDDLRRNFVILVRDSEQTQEVWARLADLGRRYSSRAPSPAPLGEDKTGLSGPAPNLNAGATPGVSPVDQARITPGL